MCAVADAREDLRRHERACVDWASLIRTLISQRTGRYVEMGRVTVEEGRMVSHGYRSRWSLKGEAIDVILDGKKAQLIIEHGQWRVVDLPAKKDAIRAASSEEPRDALSLTTWSWDTYPTLYSSGLVQMRQGP